MPHAESIGLRAPSLRRAVLIVSLALIVAAFAAASANADASHRWIRNMVGNDFCLDSNAAGTVYVNPCQRGNAYQKWQFWNGGWARNVATGRCLENPSFSFAGNPHPPLRAHRRAVLAALAVRLVSAPQLRGVARRLPRRRRTPRLRRAVRRSVPPDRASAVVHRTRVSPCEAAGTRQQRRPPHSPG